MNVVIWVLQVLLALHTATGAVWKFSNSAQSVPSLQALPHGVWLAMAVIELLCSLALLVPALYKRLSAFAALAAAFIAVEMLLYCGLHLASGNAAHGQLVYWLVVAALSALVAYARSALRPVSALPAHSNASRQEPVV
jgi:hypothetical protein